jgi:phage terminase large subunit
MTGWWIDLVERRPEEVHFDISTFRDNPFLEQSIIDEIERLKDVDPDYYQIYNQGVASRSTEAIYRFSTCTDIPVDKAQLIALGLDWGFSQDPTAIVEVWRDGDNLYLNELLYKKGQTNSDIANELRELGVDKRIDIIADSAEPKSIEEIRRYGFRIIGARKGPDSIRNGIDILKRHKIWVTEDSTNIIKELQLYKWKRDPNGILLNIPIDIWNHAMDAVRYVALNTLGNKQSGKYNISVGGSGKTFAATNDEVRSSLKKYNIR